MGISGNIKLIAFFTCISRILMHHRTFIGNRKQSSFPRSAKRRRNTSKPVWTNAVNSLPLWFHVMEFLVRSAKACVVLQNLAGSLAKKNQENPILGDLLHEVQDEHCDCTSHTSRITRPHEPNEPTSPVGRWSRPQPILRTTY